jgi:hypothetical protein
LFLLGYFFGARKSYCRNADIQMRRCRPIPDDRCYILILRLTKTDDPLWLDGHRHAKLSNDEETLLSLHSMLAPMSDRPTRTQDEIDARRELVELAKSMLLGELPFIEGATRVWSLSTRVGGVADGDTDIDAFVAIASETDHLPLQAQRHLWSPHALEALESEITQVQQWASGFATQACKNLIARFSRS